MKRIALFINILFLIVSIGIFGCTKTYDIEGAVKTYQIDLQKVNSRPVRSDYQIKDGYLTTDKAKRVNNKYYVDGIPEVEKHPAFELLHNKTTLEVAVLLLEWKDYQHNPKHSKEEYEKMFFSSGEYVGKNADGQEVYGSVNDFYQEMSYGKFKIEGTVFDWIELKGARQQYVDANFGSAIVQEEGAKAVIGKYGEHILDDFDAYVFIWAGPPVARISALWPMQVSFQDKVAIKICELYAGGISPIGLPCHELGHTFGVRDKYTAPKSMVGMGRWCLMAHGTYGYPPSEMHRPFHFCAWCKEVIGWVRPVVIDSGEHQKLALRPITYGPNECYKVLIKEDGSEYYLLENRQREGFFTDMPSTGLFIHKVGVFGARPPQLQVEVQEAHGIRLQDTRKFNRYAPFPQLWATSFTPNTSPSSRSPDPNALEAWITNIHQEDGVIYFEIGKQEDAPRDLEYQGKTYTLMDVTEKPAPRSVKWDVAFVKPKGATFAFEREEELVPLERDIKSRFYQLASYNYRFQGKKIYIASVMDYLQENSVGNYTVTGDILTCAEKTVPMAPGVNRTWNISVIDPLTLDIPYAFFIKRDVFQGEELVWAVIQKMKVQSEGIFICAPHLPEGIESEGVYSGSIENGEKPIKYVLICGMENFHNTGKILKHFVRVTEKITPSKGAGLWCLLDQGFNGGPRQKGTWPFHLGAPHKLAFGWVSAQRFELKNDPLRIALRAVEVFGDIAQVEIDDNEFMILENRNRLGLDNEIPEEGLLVWHVKPDSCIELLNQTTAVKDEVFHIKSLSGKAIAISEVDYDASGVAFASILYIR